MEPIAVVRAIHFAATILAAGVILFALLVAEPAFSAAGDIAADAQKLRRRWTWIVWASLIAAVVSGAVWLVLLAANIYAEPVGEVWRAGGVWTVMGETRFGQIWSIRLVIAALLGASMAQAPATARRRPWRALQLILATAFLISPAWVGHAGATPGVSGEFSLASDALHLLAAGAWVGGLLPLAMLLASARHAKPPSWGGVTRAAVGKFSVLGVASVGVLLASGIINSWYEVGAFGNLIKTSYGNLVLVKAGLFAAMVAIATVNRFYLTPRLGAVGYVGRLQGNAAAETVLGLTAIAVAGWLGSMAPASHEHHATYGPIPADAAFVHIHSEQGMADVMITPGRPGAARAIIRLWTDDLDTLNANNVTLTVTAPTGGRPVAHPASPQADGAWQVDGLELSEPGNWTVSVDAALPNGRLTLAAPIVIAPKAK